MKTKNVKRMLRKTIQAPVKVYKSLTLKDSIDKDAVDLSIVAIIKNEGQYIEEWVRYHIIAGVQKFYLYIMVS